MFKKTAKYTLWNYKRSADLSKVFIHNQGWEKSPNVKINLYSTSAEWAGQDCPMLS
jgi:hypothetical protein